MEFLKNKLVVVLGICNIVFLLVAVQSCVQGRKYLAVKHGEEIKRYDAEKSLNDVKQEKDALEAALRKAEESFAGERAVFDAAQKTLLQEQLINQSLKAEIDKLRKLNSALENDLKNAVVSGKAKK